MRVNLQELMVRSPYFVAYSNFWAGAIREKDPSLKDERRVGKVEGDAGTPNLPGFQPGPEQQDACFPGGPCLRLAPKRYFNSDAQ
jgi:hypothetical protein